MRLARALAIALHPAVPGFWVGLYAAIAHEGGLTIRLILVSTLVSFLCVLFPALALVGAWRLGWTRGDLWAVRRENRVFFYPAALLGLAAAWAVFTWGYPFALARTMVAAAIVVVAVMTVANRWLKVSIHCAGNAGVAAATAWVYGLGWAAPFVAAVVLVAWARVTTKNHTWLETFLGSAIGALGTLACLYVWM